MTAFFDRPQIKAYVQNHNSVNVKGRSCIFAKLTNTPVKRLGSWCAAAS